MVTIEKFNKLSLDEKAWYIWNGSTFLLAREEGRYRFNLFYMNNYYVELVYGMAENDIVKVRAFFSDAFLDDYFNEIDISRLY